MLGNRSPKQAFRAALRQETYRSLVTTVRVSTHPVDFVHRYLLGRGRYPTRCELRTPLGIVQPWLYSHDDLLTVNEIFCRRDYPMPDDCRVVVDVGSNIGISALYFLTRGPVVRTHLFEPDPLNVERLRENLRAFRGRWCAQQVAIGDVDGVVSFGRDWGVGRYGSVGSPHGEQLQVRCRHINGVLRQILESDGRIDLLKIDTEGSEVAIVQAIDRILLREVKSICFETPRPFNPWPERFVLTQSANVASLNAR